MGKRSVQQVREKYFFLFDTVCSRSSLHLRFEETPTETDRLINERDDDDGGAADNIDFLFSFAGYRYRAVTDAAVFRDEAAASISRNSPMIAQLKESCVPFAVITGYEEDRLLCPDFKCAQKSPDPDSLGQDNPAGRKKADETACRDDVAYV